MSIRLVPAFLAALALVAGVSCAEGNGLYVWQPALAMTDGGNDDRPRQLQLLQFCRQADVDVRRLYFLVDPDRVDPTSWQGLLRRADRFGVRVFALHPGRLQDAWARPFPRTRRGDHQVVLHWADRVLALDSRLAGIQLDIEPHRARANGKRVWRGGSAGLRARRNRDLALAYLELLDRVRSRLRDASSHITLAATLPTWFDGGNDLDRSAAAAYRLSLDGRDASFIRHVQARVDFVTLMNYVGDASAASRRQARRRIQGELRDGPVESMFETARPHRHAARRNESLYHAGIAAYRRLCASLRDELGDDPNYVGCAAHHYGDAFGGTGRRWTTLDSPTVAPTSP